MGGSLSNIYIYLNHVPGKYGYENEYDIEVKDKIYDKCKTFIERTHEICLRTGHKNELFNVLLYEGYGKRLFGYYSPGHEKEMLNKVCVYYSLLQPSIPLVISLKTNSGIDYNCKYNALKSAGWDYATKMSRYVFGKPLNDQLPSEHEGASGGRKITFLTTGTSNKSIITKQYQTHHGEKFKKVVYTPDLTKGSPFNLVNDKLFTLKPTDSSLKNILDPTCLSDVSKHSFDGIIVHYTKENVGLYLEFIDKCTIKNFKRNDKNGYWWVKGGIDYTDEKSLEDALEKLKNAADANDVVRYFLDRKTKYNDVTIDEEKPPKDGYSRYTHKSSEQGKKEPIILFDYKEVKGIKKFTTKLKELNVYYLKHKKLPKPDEDTIPFLLEFTENNGENLKTYYSRKLETSEWENITEKVKEDPGFEKRLEKISNLGACSDDFNIFRKTAYEILTSKKPTVESPPKGKDPPEAKKVDPPKPPIIPGLSILDLVAIVIGTFILACLITIGGYGIYWYYTTIWLLT